MVNEDSNTVENKENRNFNNINNQASAQIGMHIVRQLECGVSPKLNAKKRLFTDLSPHKDYSEIIGPKTHNNDLADKLDMAKSDFTKLSKNDI